LYMGNTNYSLVAVKDSFLRLRAGAGAYYIDLWDNGNVGISQSNPQYRLDVNGDINAHGFVRSNGLILSSDRRYKTNIHTFDNALDAILNLRGVTFDWNRDAFPDRNFSDGRQIGFIAQEVEKVLPELVSTGKDEF